MRFFLFLLFFSFFVSGYLRASDKPNLLFIIADDCTFRDIGCYGGQAKTPNIDRLATQGMQFSHCFQAAPMCSPTRHNLYTGLYPVKSGAYPNHTFVDQGTKSIAHYLKEIGYRVALSGKTHIKPREAFASGEPFLWSIFHIQVSQEQWCSFFLWLEICGFKKIPASSLLTYIA